MPLPVLAPLKASYPVCNFTARYPWNVWLLWALEDRIETLGAAVTFVDSAADRLHARVSLLFGAVLELRQQGFTEGVSWRNGTSARRC